MIPSARVVRLAVRLLRVIPPPLMRAVARVAGTLGFVVARDRRAILLENQRWLSPNATAAEQRRRARRTLVHLLEAAVDLYRLPSASRQEIERLVTVEGRHHLDAAAAAARGVIVVTAHLGPYELGGGVLALAGYPVHAMVEDLAPETNAALALYREAMGMRLLSRNGGMRSALRLLRERQFVLLVADRIVGEGSDGLVVPFGAGRRAVPTGAASLALATGAPIVTGHIARTGRSSPRYRVVLEAPIVPLPTGDAHEDRQALTAVVAARLSNAVVAHPEEWFVFQPQWLDAVALSSAATPHA